MSTTYHISNLEFDSVCFFFSFIYIKLPIWFCALAGIARWITRWPRRLEVYGSSSWTNYISFAPYKYLFNPVPIYRYSSTWGNLKGNSRGFQAPQATFTCKIYPGTSGREKITYILTLRTPEEYWSPDGNWSLFFSSNFHTPPVTTSVRNLGHVQIHKITGSCIYFCIVNTWVRCRRIYEIGSRPSIFVFISGRF